jgi:prevent-host-death family protein
MSPPKKAKLVTQTVVVDPVTRYTIVELPRNGWLITATELAARPGEIISQVHYGERPVIVTRRGKPMAMIVPIGPKNIEMEMEVEPKDSESILNGS